MGCINCNSSSYVVRNSEFGFPLEILCPNCGRCSHCCTCHSEQCPGCGKKVIKWDRFGKWDRYRKYLDPVWKWPPNGTGLNPRWISDVKITYNCNSN